MAVIDEAWCIGCTLCLDACPTDAIVGSNKLMHTVIEPWCTGCELCIPVCPVDCISLENVSGEQSGWAAWSDEAAQTAQRRYELHSKRSKNNLGNSAEMLQKPLDESAEPDAADAVASASDQKRAVIAAAIARAKAQRASKS